MYEKPIGLNEQYKVVKKELKKLGWEFRKFGKKVRIYQRGLGWWEYYIDFIYLITLANLNTRKLIKVGFDVCN